MFFKVFLGKSLQFRSIIMKSNLTTLMTSAAVIGLMSHSLQASQNIDDSAEEDKRYIAQLSVQLLNRMGKTDQSYFTSILNKINPADQKDVLEKTLSLNLPIAEWGDSTKIFYIIQILPLIPFEQRTLEISNIISSLIKKSDKSNLHIFGRELFKYLGEIPPTDRTDVLQKGFPLIVKISCPVERWYALDTLSKIESVEREDIVQKTLPWIDAATEGKRCVKILNAFSECEPVERDNVYKYLFITMEGVNADGFPPLSETVFKIIKTIRKISPAERNDVVERALPFMGRRYFHRAYINQAIGEIKSEHREDVLKMAQLLIPEIGNGYFRAKVIKTLSTIDPA
jgi:hypothetical protein